MMLSAAQQTAVKTSRKDDAWVTSMKARIEADEKEVRRLLAAQKAKL